jgi:hypothetical protein
LRNANKILIEKLEVKIPLGRPRRRWEDNIKIHFKNLGVKMWIGFIWLRIGTGGGLL